MAGHTGLDTINSLASDFGNAAANTGQGLLGWARNNKNVQPWLEIMAGVVAAYVGSDLLADKMGGGEFAKLAMMISLGAMAAMGARTLLTGQSFEQSADDYGRSALDMGRMLGHAFERVTGARLELPQAQAAPVQQLPPPPRDANYHDRFGRFVP